MELEREYTDVVYASKKEVAVKMGYHLIEPVWSQILKYRNQYMIQIDDVEICLCPGILNKMIQLNELMFQIQSVRIDHLDVLVHSEKGKWMLHHLLKTEGSFESRLHQLCLLYQMDENLILRHHSIPYALIFVLWAIMMHGDSEFGVLLLVLKLKCCGMCVLLHLLESSDFHVLKQQDMTYVLDSLLRRWIAKGQQCALSIQFEDRSDIIYLYPQLKKHQIDFYQNHHTPGYYYTIEQFVQYCDVCYETGRSSLDQLVSLGFYEKMKQGKKFVYTAR